MWKTSSCRVGFDEVHYYQDREEERKGKGKRKAKQNSLMNYYNSTVCSRCLPMRLAKVALGPLLLLIGAGFLASGI